jgi:hypothetical protein
MTQEGTLILGSAHKSPVVKSVLVHNKLLISSLTPMMDSVLSTQSKVLQYLHTTNASALSIFSDPNSLTVLLDDLVPETEKIREELQTSFHFPQFAPCAALSLVGSGVSMLLHFLQGPLKSLEAGSLHAVLTTPSDVRVTFGKRCFFFCSQRSFTRTRSVSSFPPHQVIKLAVVEQLAKAIHTALFQDQPVDKRVFGDFHASLQPQQEHGSPPRRIWWQDKRQELLTLASHEVTNCERKQNKKTKIEEKTLTLGTL